MQMKNIAQLVLFALIVVLLAFLNNSKKAKNIIKRNLGYKPSKYFPITVEESNILISEKWG